MPLRLLRVAAAVSPPVLGGTARALVSSAAPHPISGSGFHLNGSGTPKPLHRCMDVLCIRTPQLQGTVHRWASRLARYVRAQPYGWTRDLCADHLVSVTAQYSLFWARAPVLS